MEWIVGCFGIFFGFYSVEGCVGEFLFIEYILKESDVGCCCEFVVNIFVIVWNSFGVWSNIFGCYGVVMYWFVCV